MTMWPLATSGGWPLREVNYTETQLMHSECGQICRGAVGEGGLIRGGPLYNKNYLLKTFNCLLAGVRALNFGQFQHRSITSIVYGRNMSIYFALGKDFDLMVSITELIYRQIQVV